MILFKAEHVQAILDGTKTQTRRLGKKRWNVGAVHECKTNYVGKPFARVRILAVDGERPLSDISQADVESEGYATRGDYIEAFAWINKMPLGTALHCAPWVVDFELVSAVEVNDG